MKQMPCDILRLSAVDHNMTMPPIGATSAWRVAGNGGVLRLKHCKYDFYYLCRVNDIAACVAYNIRIILKQ